MSNTVYIVTGTDWVGFDDYTSIIKVFGSKDDAEEYRGLLYRDPSAVNQRRYNCVEVVEYEITRRNH